MCEVQGRFLLRRPRDPVTLSNAAEFALLALLERAPRLQSSRARNWAQIAIPASLRGALLGRATQSWAARADPRHTLEKVLTLPDVALLTVQCT